MKPAAALLTIALTGCVTQPQLDVYHPDHADDARMRREAAECEYEAIKATASYTPDTRGMRTTFGAALSSGLDMRDRRIEVGLACMRSRGYSFRPAGNVTGAFR